VSWNRCKSGTRQSFIAGNNDIGGNLLPVSLTPGEQLIAGITDTGDKHKVAKYLHESLI
jgi:hypothetical protein